MHRFFCDDPESGMLSADESHHAIQVLRMTNGDSLVVFNGRGLECKVKLMLADRKACQFEILTRQTTPEPQYRLTLGQAIPKNKVMDFILQKSTELGVAEIAPIASERSVVQLDADKKDSKVSKWRHTVLEACKQCGQNRIPTIAEPAGIDGFLERFRNFSGLKLIASLQPEARRLADVINEHKEAERAAEVVFLVGPEGDFTPSEIGRARGEGFLPVSLGPNILRTETASLFLTSALTYELMG